MAPVEQRYRYIILGAGAAGLSLCYHLLERGIRDPILILDRKASFTDDRTWCFWNVRPTPFTDLAAHCWRRWDVVDAAGHATAQISSAVGYVCLRGIDFYTSVLETIRRHDNVTLRLDSSGEDCRSFSDRSIVRVGHTNYEAEYLFDSRPRPAPDGGVGLTQRFFGQFVKTKAPCFDTSCCTLMDFRAPQERGLHFFYVLPFSPTEALIENTYIQDTATAASKPPQHREEIAAYLATQRGVADYDVTCEEAGMIPMTAYPFPKREGRMFFIGTAGGCTKPSSGYTFLRIQEQCRQIAAAAVRGTLSTFREQLAPARYRFFDTVFLQALRAQPGAFPGHFGRLFERVPPEALTAFLSETGTWHSDLQILRSLPLGPFLKAAIELLARPSIGRRSQTFGPG